MQTQMCKSFKFNLGQLSLISVPSETIPRRIEWSKWITCCSLKGGLLGRQLKIDSSLFSSQDHFDEKNDASISIFQSRFELVDFLNSLSAGMDATRYLLVGSWFAQLPAWFKSSQDILSVRYGSILQDFIEHQHRQWNDCCMELERDSNFLVVDSAGRLTALTTLCRMWRNRSNKTHFAPDFRQQSWFASSIDIDKNSDSNSIEVQLNILCKLEPLDWFGGPRFKNEIIEEIRYPLDSDEVWVSSPFMGIALWISEQFEHIRYSVSKLRVPSSILGWHPIRDLLVFMSLAKSGSYLYFIDQNASLYILKKEIVIKK